MTYYVGNRKTEEVYEAVPEKLIATIRRIYSCDENTAEHMLSISTSGLPLELENDEEAWSEM